MSWEIHVFPDQLFPQRMDDEDRESFIRNLSDWKKKIALHETGRTQEAILSTSHFTDKASLILVPLMASAGIIIPKFSGYPINGNNNALQQLESIPGFQPLSNPEDIKGQLLNIGAAILSMPKSINSFFEKINPPEGVSSKDKKEIVCILMTVILMSEVQGAVFDIKVGECTPVKNMKDARNIARSLKNICHQMNTRSSYIFSSMNQPLGQAIGNSLELIEALETLKGKGPLDVLKISLELGTEMLLLAEKVPDRVEAKKYLKRKIVEGGALKKFKEIIEAQKGNARFIDDYSLLPQAKEKIKILSREEGYIQNISIDRIRLLGRELGILRKKAGYPIDHGSGLLIYKNVGDWVEKNDILGEVHSNRIKDLSWIDKKFREAFIFSPSPPDFCPFIIERNSAKVIS